MSIAKREELRELVKMFDKLHLENENKMGGLDAGYITVKFPKNEWRLAKSYGIVKDSSRGYVVWGRGCNSTVSNLSVEIQKIASANGLVTGCYYL